MLVGTLPFDDQELNILYEHIKIDTFYIPSNLSLESIDFLKKILQVNPDKRITIPEIKNHIWFNIEKNIMYKGIDLTVETFPYNEKIIDYVIKIFYKDDTEINKINFIKMIQYHACNHYTTTYYLVEKNLEKFQNYNNEENKREKNEEINIKGDPKKNEKNFIIKKTEKHKKLNIVKSKNEEIIDLLNNKHNTNIYKNENNNNKIFNLRYKKKRQNNFKK